MKNLINLKKVIEEISINEGWLYAKTDIDIEDDAKVFFYSAGLIRVPRMNYKLENYFSGQDFPPIFQKKMWRI